MKNKLPTIALTLTAFLSLNLQPSTAFAQGTDFTYQGRVTANGTDFTGTGQFKFALVTSTNFNHTATGTANAPSGGYITGYAVTSGGSGYLTAPAVTVTGGGGSGAAAAAHLTGDTVTSISVVNPGDGNYTGAPTVLIAPPPANISYTTYWSNDGTSVAGSEPSAAVSVAVSNGLFTVVLGDSTQPNMAAVPAVIFSQPDLQLRIWFNDGVHGSAALSPVQNLTPTPYAVSANSAVNLQGSLSATQLSGTISASQLPPLVVTNNETSLTLSGSFSGNGSGLTNVPGGLPWQIVSGTTVQAQPNAGYVITNDSLVTVALPAAPNIGDLVRVSGIGAAGWKISQNAGQYVASANLNGNIGSVWRGHGANQNWGATLVSSSDGTQLAAIISAGGGHIYTSSDSGVTWTQQTNSPFAIFLAASADGTKLVAADTTHLYTSSDSGATWTQHATAPGMYEWGPVASSSDGTRLVAVLQNSAIYTSTDSGVTWVPQNPITVNFYSLVSSADGSKLAGETGYSQFIYTSVDGGTNWNALDAGFGSLQWGALASSADGNKLAAITVGTGAALYTSTNAGTNWTKSLTLNNLGSVASSADGTRLVAAQFGGVLVSSFDSGATWSAQINAGIKSWNAIASSADGSKLAGAVYGGQIYTSVPGSVSTTTTGLAGYLLGSPNSAIELQFLGNGQFLPISHEGIIQAF